MHRVHVLPGRRALSRPAHPATRTMRALGLALTLTGCGGDDPGGSGTTEPDSDGIWIPHTSDGTDTTTTASTTGTTETGDTSAMDSETAGTGEQTSGTDSDDGSTTEDPVEQCQAPIRYEPCDKNTEDIFQAIGLHCSDELTSAIPIRNPVLIAPDTTSYRIPTRYGYSQHLKDPSKPAWGPREGRRFLIFGTGTFPELEMDGALYKENDQDSYSNGNPDGLHALPGVMKHQKGSNGGAGDTPFLNCDGVHDCSDSLAAPWNLKPNNVANDVFYMSFDVTTPPGVHGYKFDLAFFSEEWPTYVGAAENDMIVVWSTSETFTGNVAVIDYQPLTVTALDPYMIFDWGDTILAGTGFLGDEEIGATGWFTVSASAAPGEIFTIAVSVFDVGNTVRDTVGMLDNFRWDCKGCFPDKSKVNTCGLKHKED